MRVDEVGRAEAVDCLPEAVTPTSPETLFFVRRFVVDQYERCAAVLEDRWAGRSTSCRSRWRTLSSWSMPTR